MPTCFVIQPFDSGKFDKRFADTYRPAIENAGLDAYRVDKDVSVDVPIDAIEEGIRDAAVVLADITTDNPNVWYELGFAFASGKPVVMVCSSEREPRKFPFDIQHRTIVTYKPESTSDFEDLKTHIAERIAAQLKKGNQLRELAASDPLTEREGLSQQELAVLASLAGDAAIPGTNVSIHSLKSDVERAGFTAVAFGLGLRRLVKKGMVELGEAFDEHAGEPYQVAVVTTRGWDWIEANEGAFSMRKGGAPPVDDFDDDIPF